MKARTSHDQVHLLQIGDEEAVQSLWEKVYGWAEDSAHHRDLDEDLAHDAAIEAFKRIMKSGLNNYQQRHEKEVGGSFRNYCRLIVLNEVKRLRDRLHRRPQIADVNLEDMAGEGRNYVPLDGFDIFELTKEGVSALQHCLEQLPEREFKVIGLQYWEGYTPQAIADGLEITRNNINQLAYRARSKLKQCLNEAEYRSIADMM